MHALLLSLALASHSRATPTSIHTDCQPPTSANTARLMANIRWEMHIGVAHRSFPRTDWQLADTATIRPVTTDSLCQLALETIQNYMDRDRAPQSIRLIYAGKYFVAEQIELIPGSEFTAVYILDQSLQHVLYPCPNAYGPSSDGACSERKPNHSP